MTETFFRCHWMSFSHHGGPEVCFKKLSSAKSECLIKFARFSPPLPGPRLVWATLSPVCTHNVQWSSMFAATMVLNVLSSSCVAASCASHHNQRYTGTLQLREQGIGTVSVQLEEQHLPLLVGTSEVPPPVQHNAKPGSLCR